MSSIATRIALPHWIEAADSNEPAPELPEDIRNLCTRLREVHTQLERLLPPTETELLNLVGSFPRALATKWSPGGTKELTYSELAESIQALAQGLMQTARRERDMDLLELADDLAGIGRDLAHVT